MLRICGHPLCMVAVLRKEDARRRWRRRRKPGKKGSKIGKGPKGKGRTLHWRRGNKTGLGPRRLRWLDTDGHEGFNGLSLRQRMANGLRSVRCRQRRRGHGRRIRRLRWTDGTTINSHRCWCLGGQKASRPCRALLRPTEV